MSDHLADAVKAVIIAAMAVSGALPMYASEPASDLPLDLEEAKAMADDLPLSDFEGVWEYPEDGVKVMILREKGEAYRYSISVVESDDVRVPPGTLIGTLSESAEPGVFRLKQYTLAKGGVLSKVADCKAKFDKRKSALIVESPSVKLNLSPGLILPLFWRRLRLITRMRTEDPAQTVPEGLRKIYPSPHGIDPRRLPIYL